MPLTDGARLSASGEASPKLRNGDPREAGDTAPQAVPRVNADVILGKNEADTDLGQRGQSQQEQEYNSEEQRNVYRNRSQSFEEQRQNYTEQAFNYYTYEMIVDHIPGRDAFRHAGHAGHAGGPHGGAENGPVPPPPAHERPDSEPELSKWAEDMLDITGENRALLGNDREKNDGKREKLEKKQPAKTKFSLKQGIYRKRLNGREYEKKRKKEVRASERRERNAAKARRTGRLLFSDENIREDEDSAAAKRTLHRASVLTKRRIKRDVRNLRDRRTVYKRLKFRDRNDGLIAKEETRLKHRQGRALAVNRKMSEWDKMSSGNADGGKAARMAENRRIQQRNRQRRKLQREKSRVTREITFGRNRHQHQLKKSARKEKRIARKRSLTVVSSVISVIGTFFMLTMFLLLFIMCFLMLFADTTVTKNEYAELTDVTEYLRNLETEVKKGVTTDRAELEERLDESCFDQTGRHVHEFAYSLPEFGFDDITLMAYLSAKFITFDLQAVRADLDELCGLMYRQSIEFREEERTFYDAGGNPYTDTVIVCYITIDKTELEDVVEARLDEDALEHYEAYKYSGGGRQVYGPVMDGDWSGKVSSNFGERIHPITGKKTFHDGVDIAVPTGTRLYSAVSGQVITARYSSSAGNMVTVRTDTGWEVTFMHMDRISVTAGQYVMRGQPVGLSGNTGNSTGPHLHIQVHDSDGRRINPMFIIPQSGHIYEQEYQE
ncbi:MAG: peptidoglycan DD-metalloendopeptidase family protein [Roseburia sp.]|nr:peptidoglycan DD-metalloendopeptidase family protein [Roseburia sp.]